MSPTEIIVIIPTYNEAENLPKIVARLMNVPGLDLGILVVDDNSPDGTGNVAEGLVDVYPGKIQVLHRPGKMGLGTAYIQGFKQALALDCAAITQMDADFSHPPEKLVEMAEALKGSDIVIGSRYISGGSVDERWPAWRKGLSAFGNWYARTILHLPIRDVTGGFRLWRAETIAQMPWELVRSSGYSFQVETAYLANRLGFRFHEIPIYFADRRWGKSKMSLKIQIEAAVRVWQMLFRYHSLEKVEQPPLFDSLAN